MANPYFQFKDFRVWHDRCAMKVGTDGVLLGAWAQAEGARTALDVGTGSGLIALMLASRYPELQVTAVDIDSQAVAQAADNFAQSTFASRLSVLEGDFTHTLILPEKQYDLIVSNPPFFREQVHSPISSRNLARSASNLPFKALLRGSQRLLSPGGRLCVIIPYDACTSFIGDAAAEGLKLSQRCDVRSTERKSPVRSLLCLTHEANETLLSELTIHASGGGYTPKMKELTNRFYL